MTARGDFTPEDWQVVLEGPPSAGMIAVTAQRGGTFRESIAMAKAYVEARKQHGESELLDEIVSVKPEIDHTRYHSAEELKENGLKHLRDAVELVERKATGEELEDTGVSLSLSRRRSRALTGRVGRASAPRSKPPSRKSLRPWARRLPESFLRFTKMLLTGGSP